MFGQFLGWTVQLHFDASSWHRCNERKRCKTQRTENGNSLPPRFIQLVFDPKGFQKSQSQGIPSGRIIAGPNTRTDFFHPKCSWKMGTSPVFQGRLGWWNTLPETNMTPENRLLAPRGKETIVFQPSIFRCCVSFKEGIIIWPNPLELLSSSSKPLKLEDLDQFVFCWFFAVKKGDLYYPVSIYPGPQNHEKWRF